MGLMLHPTTGRLLLAPSGWLAGSAACCCETLTCCVCDWIEAYHASGGRIKVSISGGGISGYLILCADDTLAPDDNCSQWTHVCDDFSTNLTIICGGLVASSAMFYCGRNNSFVLDLDITSADCEVFNISRVSISCGPPLSIAFAASLRESLASGCAPCMDGEAISITVENLDPWPP